MKKQDELQEQLPGEQLVHDAEAYVTRRWNYHANLRTIFLVAILAVVFFYAEAFINKAPQNFFNATGAPVTGDAEVTQRLVAVPKGVSLQGVVDALEKDSVVRSAFWLKMIIKIRGREDKVYAGDYLFKKPATLLEVAQRITSPNAFGLEPVTVLIPEGSTVKEIGKIFEKKLIAFKAEEFVRQAEQYEGYLFPDTYNVLPNSKEADVIKIMQNAFYKKIEPLQADIKKSNYSLHDVVTIASILEKEENDTADRKMIASVIDNRLKINMPLQVDATFLYILGKGTFGLTLKDLKNESPYNTYRHGGLPPGPINNPGMNALDAVVHPTPNPYIFYLADKYGKTYYSKTYAEHLVLKKLHIDSQR
ncbi:MAG: endolytic transglycosylase MltG [Minisyncoccia bacterium]